LLGSACRLLQGWRQAFDQHGGSFRCSSGLRRQGAPRRGPAIDQYQKTGAADKKPRRFREAGVSCLAPGWR
jgi:hypothetical protein